MTDASPTAKSLYSLRKAKKIYRWAYAWQAKVRHKLSKHEADVLENDLENLKTSLATGDRVQADTSARALESFGKVHFKKTFLGYLSEMGIALALALFIAIVVRQMMFEPYEIPTGSMRPTFREKDHILVSKAIYGINTPLQASHLYFEPEVVQRVSTVIFSGENIDLPDTDAPYFGVIPYTKRYIKRLMGKPGDVLYFYGGKIYGYDVHGNDLSELRDSPHLAQLEYIPFLTFEGKVMQDTQRQGNGIGRLLFLQMNKPIGRLSLLNLAETEGEIFNGSAWIKDSPTAQKSAHDRLLSYSDFWGMRNFAMARLLTRKQVELYSGVDMKALADGVLYLELRHTPSLSYPKPRLVRDDMGRTSLLLTPYVTVIPLQQAQIDQIRENIYTARFVVSGGYAKRYSAEFSPVSPTGNPAFPHVPDGTYEFYHGQGVEVTWGAITRDLPPDHPLNSKEPAMVQKLYNMGMEMETAYEPRSVNQRAFPLRYAYFRDGDLYLLGAPILKKGDALLSAFVQGELARQAKSTRENPYVAFHDYGPPLHKDGSLDKEFIKTFGLALPEKHYLVLGDNHAMSGDSRIFGFVPEDNLQGSASLIVWPPGNRWGVPNQTPYPWFTVSRVTVWGTFFLLLAAWYSWYVMRDRRLFG